MKPDEAALWASVLNRESPRAAGRRLGIHPRRVAYLCVKWSRRGVYDYGVCADLGWPTGRPGSGRVKIRRARECAA